MKRAFIRVIFLFCIIFQFVDSENPVQEKDLSQKEFSFVSVSGPIVEYTYQNLFFLGQPFTLNVGYTDVYCSSMNVSLTLHEQYDQVLAAWLMSSCPYSVTLLMPPTISPYTVTQDSYMLISFVIGYNNGTHDLTYYYPTIYDNYAYLNDVPKVTEIGPEGDIRWNETSTIYWRYTGFLYRIEVMVEVNNDVNNRYDVGNFDATSCSSYCSATFVWTAWGDSRDTLRLIAKWPYASPPLEWGGQQTFKVQYGDQRRGLEITPELVGAIGACVMVVGCITTIVCVVKRRRNKKKREARKKDIESIELKASSSASSETKTEPQTAAYYVALNPSKPPHSENMKYADFMDNENGKISEGHQSTNGGSQKRASVPNTNSQWEIAFSELKFDKEVGSGAYGHVFSGIWRESPVAIKVLKSQLSTSEIQDFIAESEVMMKLRPHKNVVQLLGICSKPPNFCMVMEFLGGGSLAGYVKANSLDDVQMLEIVKGMAAGMYHLACEKIVHRDLAARNILMDSSGVPKVSDFGMSRVLQQNDEGKTKNTIGPIKWMAPESLANLEYSEKSDVWSFGVVLWEALTKSLPHNNMSILDAAIQIRDKGLTLTIPPGTNRLWVDLMTMCWNQSPHLRPSFKDICKFLNDVTVS